MRCGLRTGPSRGRLPLYATATAAMHGHGLLNSERVKADASDYPYLSSYLPQLETETDVDRLVRIVMEIIRNQAA